MFSISSITSDYEFLINLRPPVTEQPPGETVCCQGIQIELCKNNALRLAVHGFKKLSGTVCDEGGAVKLKG